MVVAVVEQHLLQVGAVAARDQGRQKYLLQPFPREVRRNGFTQAGVGPGEVLEAGDAQRADNNGVRRRRRG